MGNYYKRKKKNEQDFLDIKQIMVIWLALLQQWYESVQQTWQPRTSSSSDVTGTHYPLSPDQNFETFMLVDNFFYKF